MLFNINKTVHDESANLADYNNLFLEKTHPQNLIIKAGYDPRFHRNLP